MSNQQQSQHQEQEDESIIQHEKHKKIPLKERARRAQEIEKTLDDESGLLSSSTSQSCSEQSSLQQIMSTNDQTEGEEQPNSNQEDIQPSRIETNITELELMQLNIRKERIIHGLIHDMEKIVANADRLICRISSKSAKACYLKHLSLMTSALEANLKHLKNEEVSKPFELQALCQINLEEISCDQICNNPIHKQTIPQPSQDHDYINTSQEIFPLDLTTNNLCQELPNDASYKVVITPSKCPLIENLSSTTTINSRELEVLTFKAKQLMNPEPNNPSQNKKNKREISPQREISLQSLIAKKKKENPAEQSYPKNTTAHNPSQTVSNTNLTSTGEITSLTRDPLLEDPMDLTNPLPSFKWWIQNKKHLPIRARTIWIDTLNGQPLIETLNPDMYATLIKRHDLEPTKTGVKVIFLKDEHAVQAMLELEQNLEKLEEEKRANIYYALPSLNGTNLQIASPKLSIEEVELKWSIKTPLGSNETANKIADILCKLNRKNGKEVLLFKNDFLGGKAFKIGPKDDKGRILRYTHVKFYFSVAPRTYDLVRVHPDAPARKFVFWTNTTHTLECCSDMIICFNCLNPGHLSTNCDIRISTKNRSFCPKCNANHNPLSKNCPVYEDLEANHIRETYGYRGGS